MKCCRWLLRMVFVGLLLYRSGWLPRFTRPARTEQPAATERNPFASRAAYQYQRGGPRHWRYCLLQP
jgi:hypothetical protein